ncbi:MAG TPA: NAD(P)H-binding protein [Gaiellaceae bacterium]|nr:NAD(P)H-binding protein [Gaiellaceae bacterium]
MRIVVFGATGTVGRPLLTELARTHAVFAVSRRPQLGNEATWIQADVLDAASVRRAVDGAEVVYYLVHSLGEGDFEERDAKAAETVAREAERAGVRQLVYLGGLGDASPALSAHLRSRHETAERLGAGRVPLTTLRAAVVVGAGSAAFETIVALVDRVPVMVAPRWVSTLTQPIALADVVAYLAGVAGQEEAFAESYDVGGPEVMTYREMVEAVARLRGKRRAIVEVPVLTPRLSSLWLHLVTPVKAAVARPLVEGLSVATVAADDRIRRIVPIEPTTFPDAARTALAGR